MDALNIGIKHNKKYERYKFSEDIVRDIKALKPDNYHGFAYILKDYLIIALLIGFAENISYWFYPLALIFIGAHQRALSTILHDAAHGVLARNKTLNFILGTVLTAWPIFQKFFSYRKSHVLTHHPMLGKLGSDPDLTFFEREGVFDFTSKKRYVLRVLVLPMLGSKTIAYLGYLVKNRYKYLKGMVSSSNNKSDIKSKKDFKWYFDKFGFYAFWSSVIFLAYHFQILVELIIYWIVPYLTSFHIIGWFIEMSEHCSSTIGKQTDIYMTRNRQSRGIEKLLTGINNDHLHLDHHLNPSTPFWLLDQAHKIRLRDRNYATHCAESGGLFMKGPNGEPSIISLIIEQNQKYKSANKMQEV